MRAAFLVLLLACAWAPAAAAQAPTQTAGFEIEPFEGPLPPLVEVSRNWTLRLACDSLPVGESGEVHVWVGSRPTWLLTKIVPDVVAREPCLMEQVVQGVLLATASDQAPALQAGQIEIGVSHMDALGANTTAKNAMPVTPGYFGVLDLQAPETIAIVRPGEAKEFPLKLTNFGNGPGRVSIDLVGAGETLTVDPIEPFVLDSKQTGGSQISRDLAIVVRTDAATGFVNHVGVVNLAIRMVHDVDDAFGDDSSVSLLLTTRGVDVPGPSPASLAFALALALALVAMTSHRRAS